MIRTAFIETNDLSLCAALLAMEIPPSDETPIVKLKTTNGEQYKFFMQERSLCGKYKTADLILAWNNPKFEEENPDHPFAYIKAAFKNRDGLLDVVKRAIAKVVINVNGKMIVMPENASPAYQQKIFSQL